MYKVFFKDRIVFFRNDFLETLPKNSGLFYKYGSGKELKALINAYYDLNEIGQLYLIHKDIEFVWKKFLACFNPVIAAGGLVTNRDNKFLVIFRNGIWDLPKGKVDPGESIEETAVREVREECGIHSLACGRKITETYHTYRIGDKNILKLTHWFEMRYEGNSIPIPQEEENITEIRWVAKDDMAFVFENTYPSIVEVLNAYSG